MNVLSLFDGISCAQLALAKAGIKYTKYYSSEIDKFAIKKTQENYPNTIQIGNINDWESWDIDFSKIDLLLAGFPCQAWSVAGKMQGDSDPRGQLVYPMIEIWKHIEKVNPNLKFLFENVKMKKIFIEYINKLFGVEPILIDSALVSAQNRKRLYWTNIPNVEQPEDKGLTLENVIGWSRSTRYPKDRDKYVEQRVRIDGKANTLVTGSGCGSFSSKNYIDDKYYLSEKLLKGFERKKTRRDKTNAGSGFNKTNVRDVEGKCSSITSRYFKMSSSDPYIEDTKGIRKLTPEECEALQTMPLGYTDGLSDTQRYKAIGNGWTIDVIAHILKGLK